MLCKIAEILTDVPAEGNMDTFCRDYMVNTNEEASIVIDASWYSAEKWPNIMTKDIPYMDSARQFYLQLLTYNGMMLHASCIVIREKAYLISGPCRIGKSTHTKLLKKYYGGQILNDDKPALRLIDNQWIAYGTPWSGKNHINMNISAPIQGICFMTENRSHNEIRRLDTIKSISEIMSQSTFRLKETRMNQLLILIDNLVRQIPIYEMDSLANEESAIILYDTMKGKP